MEDKEFNLSNCIRESGNEYGDNIHTSFIKEFIKHCLADGWDEQFVNPNEDFNNGVQWMKERINKLAGDKLA